MLSSKFLNILEFFFNF